MKKSEVVQAWGTILAGRMPSISIEITKECPLRCPGCYAFEANHLGGGTQLRELSDFRGDELVRKFLEVIDEQKPLHVSIVGGDPLVRYRELDKLIPELDARGVHAQIVTSAFRVVPSEWFRFPRVTVVVSIDGLQPEHDERRKPATYERILKTTADAKITIHSTITSQIASRPGYLEEFLAFWSARPQTKKIWFSLFTPQRGATDPEILSPGQRAAVMVELLRLRPLYPPARYAGVGHSRNSLSPIEPRKLYLCSNDTHHLRGSEDQDHALSVRRRSRLRTVRMHRFHGAGGRRSSQSRWLSHRRPDLYGLRTVRKRLEKDAKRVYDSSHSLGRARTIQDPAVLTSGKRAAFPRTSLVVSSGDRREHDTMPLMLQVRGVLFDMDGVLISSTGSDERCWARWARLRGLEQTFSIKAAHGRRVVDTVRALRPDLDPHTEARLLEDFDAEDHEGLLVLPGVESLLAGLPSGCWTIVTSASARLMTNRLGHAGISIPASVVVSDHVTNGKPHPEPYEAGARLLGLHPSDCLVIEDAPAGVRAGKAAGCKVLAVLSSHTADDLAGADWIVPSLEHVVIRESPSGTLCLHLDV